MSPTEATSFDVGGNLSEAHAALIRASAISDAVRDARGYRTIDTPEELLALGFADWQARQAPGLYLPSWRVDGSNGSGQFRPDSPTPDKKGNVRKYLAPTGARNVLDVHPMMTARLQDATVPLIITEGARKADALTTISQCAVALTGVWNWKTRTEDDESITLEDFEEIRLSGRRVVLMFDSDARSNANVRLALQRLADMLTARGAQVETILPPDGPGGTKQGIDDFLGAGVYGKTSGRILRTG
jgi:putative DNA primase/helicase